MTRFLFVHCLLLVLLSGTGNISLVLEPASAEGTTAQEENPLGRFIGIIDDTLVLDFEPTMLFALYQDKAGRLTQYRAAASLISTPSVEAEKSSLFRSFVVGAPLHFSPEKESSSPFRFIFVARGENKNLAHSPIQTWDAGRLRENSKGATALEMQIANAKTELAALEAEKEEVKKTVATLKSEASSIAGVDAIVELQMQYDSLIGVEEEKDTEVERITRLINHARELPEPANVDSLRSNLAQNLQAAAKVTALADRLERRSKDAAVQKFKKKVKLVREMENADTRALAQEVLELRKRRRELENRLGKTSQDSMDRDF